jgi:hypothetical protein
VHSPGPVIGGTGLNSAISESCNWQGERSDSIFDAEV